MVRSRWATALVGVVLSLVVSALAWYFFETALLFLFVPFVPFLLRRRTDESRGETPVLECPVCGFDTQNPAYEYCPRDGTRLE